MFTLIKHGFLSGVFDQSERAKGLIYILNADKPRGMLVEHEKNLFTNSSSVLPTSRVVYQPTTHRNLWPIA